MKVFETDQSFHSNITNKAQYSIGDPRIICKILSDSLYSNKISSIIRELSANAYDAHKEAGITDRPFEVHLPQNEDGLFLNSSTNYFSIRDFGKGLSEEEMISIYTMYGTSTKRDTNQMIGGFGIGCKSPFAYTKQFEVISFNNGKKKHYLCYIDENDYPCISKILDEETNEPSGLMVKINMQDNNDGKDFIVESISQYALYPVKPKCNIAIPEMEYFIDNENYSLISIENKNDINDIIEVMLAKNIKNNGYANSFVYNIYSSSSFFVLMNNCAYEIPVEIQKELANKYNIKSILKIFENSSVMLKLKTGDIDVSASRECIAVTPKTLDSITKKFDEFFECFLPDICKKMEGLNDMEILCCTRLNHIKSNSYYNYSYSSQLNLLDRFVVHTEFERKVIEIIKYGVRFDAKTAVKYLQEKSIRFMSYSGGSTLYKGYHLSKTTGNVTNYAYTYKEHIGKDNVMYINNNLKNIKNIFVNNDACIKDVKKKFVTSYNTKMTMYNIFFTTDKDDIEEINSLYHTSNYEIVDVPHIVEKKPYKNYSRGYFECDKYDISSYYINYYNSIEMQIKEFRKKGKRESIKYEDFFDLAKKDTTVIFVTDRDNINCNNELEYQSHLFYLVISVLKKNFVEKLGNNEKCTLILINNDNYKKYVNNYEVYGAEKLDEKYAYEKVMKMLKIMGMDYDNLIDIMHIYNASPSYCQCISKYLSKDLLDKELAKKNEFFEIVGKIQNFLGIYGGTSDFIKQLNELHKLYVKDDNVFETENESVKQFFDYLNKNPILYFMAQGMFTSFRNYNSENLKFHNIDEIIEHYIK